MKGKSMSAGEVERGWVLYIDGKDRTVHDYRLRTSSKEDQPERDMTIWFTDGHWVSGDEGQTVYVVSEDAKKA